MYAKLSFVVAIFSFLFSFFSSAVHPDFVSESSRNFERTLDADIQAVYKTLLPELPETHKIHFKFGQVFMDGDGQLVWRNKAGLEHVLVTKEVIPTGQGLSGFEISPNGLRVAYFTTEGGQDLKSWNVVNIRQGAKPLLRKPILNRMEGFSWGQDSGTLYYSFWHDKEAVARGEKPILEIRSRNIATGKDEIVFDPRLAENFGIAEVNQGETLIAYRLLNPNYGIKTSFSMYAAQKTHGRIGEWKRIYPRNKYIGIFLGTFNNKALILTERSGDTYAVEAVDPLTGRVEVMVPAQVGKVLHLADVVGENLILQYHTVDTQAVSVEVFNLQSKSFIKATKTKSLGLSEYGDLDRFKVAVGGAKARAVYTDVMNDDHVLELELNTFSLKKLANVRSAEFKARDFADDYVSFQTSDGTKITGRLFYPKNKKPEYVVLRYYGWISVKNTPETRDIRMTLLTGGAYFVADMPGGGEKGAKWFYQGSRERLKMVGYIAEASRFLQNKLQLQSEQVVALGRSWGGLTSLLLSAHHSSDFGVIVSAVPVIDVEDMLKNSYFGRTAHSDLAPRVNRQGNYILDQSFQAYVRSINPSRLVERMQPNSDLLLFTSGKDDRVDQGGDLEAEFASRLKTQLGDRLLYHRSVMGNHSGRFYEQLLFSYLKRNYGLTVNRVQADINQCVGFLK